MPIASRTPVRPTASPPPGMNWVKRATMMPAATNSSTPMPIWMRRCGQRDTKPAPSQAPAHRGADHQHQRRHVDLDDGDEDERLREASARVWPTFSVPGICASSTTRPSLNSDVVVANEPIPSVSKKSVTAPMTSCTGVGQPAHFARACRNQKTRERDRHRREHDEQGRLRAHRPRFLPRNPRRGSQFTSTRSDGADEVGRDDAARSGRAARRCSCS